MLFRFWKTCGLSLKNDEKVSHVMFNGTIVYRASSSVLVLADEQLYGLLFNLASPSSIKV